MPISKGEDWGALGGLAVGAPVVRSDAELRRLVESARRRGTDVGEVGLLGGDLARTLGASGDEAHVRSPSGARLGVDIIRVTADGTTSWCVAHAVLRNRWWAGRVVGIMNAAHHGRWNPAPRAHPGDSLVDIVDARIPWRHRREARHRLPSGSHVPHPDISIRRAAAGTVELDRPTMLWLDGDPVGRVTRVEFEVEPAAVVVVV